MTLLGSRPGLTLLAVVALIIIALILLAPPVTYSPTTTYYVVETSYPSTPTPTPCNQGRADYDAARNFNYRGTYFAANPKLRPFSDKIIVHHAVPLEVILKRPCTFTVAELNSSANLRGIPKSLDATLHQSTIQISWNNFFGANPNATRAQISSHTVVLDAAHNLPMVAYLEFKVSP